MPNNWPQWKKRHPDQERVARRFRHHVRTAANPKGRIRRENCAFCDCPPDPVPSPIGEIPAVHAHHVDYSKPFLVVWTCEACHRLIEDEKLRVLRRHLWDYSSLVRTIPKQYRNGPRVPRRKPEAPAAPEEAA